MEKIYGKSPSELWSFTTNLYYSVMIFYLFYLKSGNVWMHNTYTFHIIVTYLKFYYVLWLFKAKYDCKEGNIIFPLPFEFLSESSGRKDKKYINRSLLKSLLKRKLRVHSGDTQVKWLNSLKWPMLPP